MFLEIISVQTDIDWMEYNFDHTLVWWEYLLDIYIFKINSSFLLDICFLSMWMLITDIFISQCLFEIFNILV
jgi:hypothetical protein